MPRKIGAHRGELQALAVEPEAAARIGWATAPERKAGGAEAFKIGAAREVVGARRHRPEGGPSTPSTAPRVRRQQAGLAHRHAHITRRLATPRWSAPAGAIAGRYRWRHSRSPSLRRRAGFGAANAGAQRAPGPARNAPSPPQPRARTAPAEACRSGPANQLACVRRPPTRPQCDPASAPRQATGGSVGAHPSRARHHRGRQPQDPALPLQRPNRQGAARRKRRPRVLPRARFETPCIARNERRHTLRPLADRLPPYRGRAHGAIQLAVRQTWAANTCCGSRTPTAPAPRRRPSRRLSMGCDWLGLQHEGEITYQLRARRVTARPPKR